MQLFMANKQMMMNIGLNEIKNMAPEEMFLMVGELRQMGEELEEKRQQQNGI